MPQSPAQRGAGNRLYQRCERGPRRGPEPAAPVLGPTEALPGQGDQPGTVPGENGGADWAHTAAAEICFPLEGAAGSKSGGTSAPPAAAGRLTGSEDRAGTSPVKGASAQHPAALPTPPDGRMDDGLIAELRAVSEDWLQSRAESARTIWFLNRRPTYERELPGVRTFVARGPSERAVPTPASAAAVDAANQPLCQPGKEQGVGCAFHVSHASRAGEGGQQEKPRKLRLGASKGPSSGSHPVAAATKTTAGSAGSVAAGGAGGVGDVVGFAFLDPMFSGGKVIGYYANIVQTVSSAPAGTAGLVIQEVLRTLAKEGVPTLSLGLSPFYCLHELPVPIKSCPEMRYSLQWTFKHCNEYYPFRNLAMSKSKYGGGSPVPLSAEVPQLRLDRVDLDCNSAGVSERPCPRQNSAKSGKGPKAARKAKSRFVPSQQNVARMGSAGSKGSAESLEGQSGQHGVAGTKSAQHCPLPGDSAAASSAAGAGIAYQDAHVTWRPMYIAHRSQWPMYDMWRLGRMAGMNRGFVTLWELSVHKPLACFEGMLGRDLPLLSSRKGTE